MKKIVVATAALAALSLAGPAAALEASGDVYAGIYSQYLWRGIDFSGNQPVAQGGVDVSLGSFTVSYWTNMQLVSDDAGAPLLDSGEITETDLVLDYSRDLTELVSLSVGNIIYAFNTTPTTSELYLGLGLDTLLAPAFTVYWDWDEAPMMDADGLYYTLSAGHTFAVRDDLGVNLGALVSYNQESPFVGDYSDWHNYELAASVDFTPLENLTITPSLLFSDGISDDAQETLANKLVSGLAVTLAF